ncbi:hypothetical protein [Pimelobacter simplex]|nr:hypothetical protein [Pimelobacter simplex]
MSTTKNNHAEDCDHNWSTLRDGTGRARCTHCGAIARRHVEWIIEKEAE